MDFQSSTQAGSEGNQIKSNVNNYYGKVLQKTEDLKTNACCSNEVLAGPIKLALDNIHTAVKSRYYGCGLVIPDLLLGLRVLDLGCGAGRDCYILSQLVGPTGYVVGIDMTDEQLQVANDHVAWHMEKFGFSTPNIEFRKGYIEKLNEIGLPDASFDLIISNCVVNLSPDKNAVFTEAYRLLKPGGEMYFSDVYSDRRVSSALRADPVLWGECLSGALYWKDFLHLSKSCGFKDPRLVTSRPLKILNPSVEALLGLIGFTSATYRLWKVEGMEEGREDYGQAVIYKGSLPSHPHSLSLDGLHSFQSGKISLVDGNTFRILSQSRFSSHFSFLGDFEKHYGSAREDTEEGRQGRGQEQGQGERQGGRPHFSQPVGTSSHSSFTNSSSSSTSSSSSSTTTSSNSSSSCCVDEEGESF